MDIIRRDEAFSAFSEHRFQVSGVRFQEGGARELNPDTLYETTPKWHGFLMINLTAFQASGGWIKQRSTEYRISNRKIMKDGIAAPCLLN